MSTRNTKRGLPLIQLLAVTVFLASIPFTVFAQVKDTMAAPVAITVDNPGFEQDTSDGSMGTWGDLTASEWGGTIAGWTTTTTHVTLMRNTANVLAAPAEGHQYAFMQYLTTPQTETLEQTVNEKTEANTCYKLTVAVQMPIDKIDAWDTQLVIDGTTYNLPATEKAKVTPHGTAFTDVTLMTPVIATAGKDIKIVITSTGSADTYQFNFDNVRLQKMAASTKDIPAVPVVVPATTANVNDAVKKDTPPVDMTVANPGFEQDESTGSMGIWDNLMASTWDTPVTGWTLTGSVNVMRDTNVLKAPREGHQYAFMQYSDNPSKDAIEQTIKDKTEANVCYKLTVAVEIPNNQVDAWDIQLVIDGTVYSLPMTEKAKITPKGTEYKDVTLLTPIITTAGKDIKINITSTGSNDWSTGGYQFMVDNVRLQKLAQ